MKLQPVLSDLSECFNKVLLKLKEIHDKLNPKGYYDLNISLKELNFYYNDVFTNKELNLVKNLYTNENNIITF